MTRASVGYLTALAIGAALGIAVARNKVLRSAIGSLITGLQTMPSIVWFPLAIVLFKLTEQAILFVVVLGAAPSIANGVISGIDHVPPTLIRAGRSLGARGLVLQRHVVVPAALPGVVAGLKQGWAFAWRSLMAGELIVIIDRKPALGSGLQLARDVSDYEGLVAKMVVILVVGIVVDALLFGRMERAVRSRFGLIDEARPA
jgi:NitT/TauT family transport system permease protein